MPSSARLLNESYHSNMTDYEKIRKCTLIIENLTFDTDYDNVETLIQGIDGVKGV